MGRAGQLCGSRHSQGLCTGDCWKLFHGAPFRMSGANIRLKYSHSPSIPDVQIWDVAAAKRVNVLSGHSARWQIILPFLVRPLKPWSMEFTSLFSRVGALAWNGDMLSSGSRDRFILQRDVRTPRFKIIRFEVFLYIAVPNKLLRGLPSGHMPWRSCTTGCASML